MVPALELAGCPDKIERFQCGKVSMFQSTFETLKL